MGLAGALVCLGVETLVSADRTLRPLDRAFLERWVQADALAVSAIGIAGAELPALADQVAAQRVDMAAMIAVLRESLRSVDGTAWFAVVPGEADQRQGFLIPTPTAPRQFTAERKQRGSRERRGKRKRLHARSEHQRCYLLCALCALCGLTCLQYVRQITE